MFYFFYYGKETFAMEGKLFLFVYAVSCNFKKKIDMGRSRMQINESEIGQENLNVTGNYTPI